MGLKRDAESGRRGEETRRVARKRGPEMGGLLTDEERRLEEGRCKKIKDGQGCGRVQDGSQPESGLFWFSRGRSPPGDTFLWGPRATLQSSAKLRGSYDALRRAARRADKAKTPNGGERGTRPGAS